MEYCNGSVQAEWTGVSEMKRPLHFMGWESGQVADRSTSVETWLTIKLSAFILQFFFIIIKYVYKILKKIEFYDK